MDRLTVKAFAKINLYLDVVGKRPNGYHDLVTVMQRISLYDTLTVERVAGEGIRLDTGCALPADDSNLICRAARAFFARSGHPFGVSVVLDKQIPMQAGMGGGSADAAAMLCALNHLDGDRFSVEELCALGATIGADVPFCVVGGTQLCRGIGERMEPLENRLQGVFVVAIGGEGVSTPAAFGELDRRYGDFAASRPDATPHNLIVALRAGDTALAAPHFYNMFEEAIEPMRPAVGRWKEILRAQGAIAAMMSGSGPSVWGLFSDLAAAEQAKSALVAAGARAFVCERVDQ